MDVANGTALGGKAAGPALALHVHSQVDYRADTQALQQIPIPQSEICQPVAAVAAPLGGLHPLSGGIPAQIPEVIDALKGQTPQSAFVHIAIPPFYYFSAHSGSFREVQIYSTAPTLHSRNMITDRAIAFG